MVKEFKTVDELISLLESRNVRTDADTAQVLLRDGYYSVVNGYKEPFLDRVAMQSMAGDVYKVGTTFRQIYDLYLLDRDLRNLFFPYLTLAEGFLKNATVYAFCHQNPEPTAYLDRSSYVDSQSMLTPRHFKGNRARRHSANLTKLIGLLYEKVSIDSGKPMRDYVRHYVDKYGCVPLWVLQNDMTFGNMAHFYQLQKRGVQSEACRIIASISGAQKRLQPIDILRVYSVLTEFRNICAHNERLYCALRKSADLGEMLALLSLVIPRKDARTLRVDLNSLLEEYRERVPSEVLSALNGAASRIASEDV